MNVLLLLASAAEGVTGLALLISPRVVSRLLFGAEVDGTGVLASRVGGLALIAICVACWPSPTNKRGLCVMLTYSTAVAIYLIWIGIAGQWAGTLLWPAAAAHVLLSTLLIVTRLRQLPSPEIKS